MLLAGTCTRALWRTQAGGQVLASYEGLGYDVLVIRSIDGNARYPR